MNDLRVDFDELEWDADRGAFWQGQPFTGITYDCTPQGPITGEYSYVDGVQTGLSREWYLSGAQKTAAMYRHGSLNGSYQAWFENGQLQQEAEYELSILLKSRRWDETGQLVQEYTLDASSPDFSHLQLLRGFRLE